MIAKISPVFIDKYEQDLTFKCLMFNHNCSRLEQCTSPVTAYAEPKYVNRTDWDVGCIVQKHCTSIQNCLWRIRRAIKGLKCGGYVSIIKNEHMGFFCKLSEEPTNYLECDLCYNPKQYQVVKNKIDPKEGNKLATNSLTCVDNNDVRFEIDFAKNYMKEVEDLTFEEKVIAKWKQTAKEFFFFNDRKPVVFSKHITLHLLLKQVNKPNFTNYCRRTTKILKVPDLENRIWEVTHQNVHKTHTLVKTEYICVKQLHLITKVPNNLIEKVKNVQLVYGIDNKRIEILHEYIENIYVNKNMRKIFSIIVFLLLVATCVCLTWFIIQLNLFIKKIKEKHRKPTYQTELTITVKELQETKEPPTIPSMTSVSSSSYESSSVSSYMTGVAA
ncbi:hypothetical protein SNEBB_004003 [Seison nebaliae]|nr:hypothetical protein SNEBB_004003 [Seison nebaliae]